MKDYIVVFIALIVVGFASISHAERLPLSNFSNLPKHHSVSVSPSGKRIAFVQNYQQNGGVSVLSTLDFESGESKFMLTSDNVKVKFNWFEWANDDILLISARYETKERQLRYYQTRLLSMNAADKEPKAKLLLKPSLARFGNKDNNSQFQDNVIDYLPDDPEHILLSVDLDVPNMPSVYRVNIRTGKKRRVERGKLSIRNWITDQQNQIRVGYTYDYKTADASYLIRTEKGASFETLFEFNAINDKPKHVLGFAIDPNILYYSAYKGDFRAVYKLRIDTNESELVLAHEDRDVSGGVIYSKKTGDVIGIYDRLSSYGRYYFDKRNYALNRGLEAIFEGTKAYITDMTRDETKYVALIESDDKAPEYYWGDRTDKSINLLFEQYPDLYQKKLSHHKLISFEARDGVSIEGYLTLPLVGEAPYPTVLHPHGGPGARDQAGFDPWVAYMANRGYAVLRPNFRGSTGYGYEFAQAQMGRWGLEMQDDLTDATEWLIESGVADKDKICIFGASYGGYAAMMAAVKTPELYTCAVSFAGVSDLKMLRRTGRKFLGGKVRGDAQLGDDTKDLNSRSPIRHVEKIATPMLIMHGSDDIVVRVNQSRYFVEELIDEKKKHKYVEFENGDHYLSIQKNRHLFFDELDAFFAEHLGVPAASATGAEISE